MRLAFYANEKNLYLIGSEDGRVKRIVEYDDFDNYLGKIYQQDWKPNLELFLEKGNSDIINCLDYFLRYETTDYRIVDQIANEKFELIETSYEFLNDGNYGLLNIVKSELEAKHTNKKMIIVIDGGIIQEIISNDTSEKVEIFVTDYDFDESLKNGTDIEKIYKFAGNDQFESINFRYAVPSMRGI